MTDQTNALGLEFTQESSTVQSSVEESQSNTTPDVPTNAPQEPQPNKPYLNPNRVKTGGNPREKPSEEALEERMRRIREQNEKIKQRRLDVLKDEEAFKKTQEEERAKAAHQRKVRTVQDKQREANAKRKLERAEGREWDSEKLNKSKKPPSIPLKNQQKPTEAGTSAATEAAAEEHGEEEEEDYEEEDDWRLPAAPKNYPNRESSNAGGKTRKSEQGHKDSGVDLVLSAWGAPVEEDPNAKWFTVGDETPDYSAFDEWGPAPGADTANAGDNVPAKKFGLAKGKKDKKKGAESKPAGDSAQEISAEHGASAWGLGEEKPEQQDASNPSVPIINWNADGPSDISAWGPLDDTTEGVGASQWASAPVDNGAPSSSDRGKARRGKGRGERGGRRPQDTQREGKEQQDVTQASTVEWNPNPGAAADWGAVPDEKKEDTATNIPTNWGAEPPPISSWGVEPPSVSSWGAEPPPISAWGIDDVNDTAKGHDSNNSTFSSDNGRGRGRGRRGDGRGRGRGREDRGRGERRRGGAP
ncbi:hypothetical protein CVT24_005752 [Panaeolus cyanescens]|uniref:Uncharacterized protein n=1 Tax=Panaeolus cyanescens TaxID=181874 RepID=A0A409VEB1_9AGAR|nr:hypothetical protein CVT24_005752 [Panaeolus cyanescens]